MAAQNTGMKFPTRPAPSLPGNKTNVVHQSFVENPVVDPFSPLKSQSTKQDKRKPPPRPPPPKALGSQVTSNQRRSIFGSTKKKQQKAAATAIVKPLPPASNIPVGTLIDLHSPPGSPQFPTKLKSSLSVGNISSYTSNVSLIESGFEDDFNSILSSTATTPAFDPWSTNSDFTPSSSKTPSPDLLSSQNITKPDVKSKNFKYISKNQSVTRPTIICVPSVGSTTTNRAKPVRPPPPSNSALFNLKLDDNDLVVLNKEGSPPMPCIPPPPPPPEVFNGISSAPPVPPRPTEQVNLNEKQPYCIAQYDYDSTHPDDLEFKAGDVISQVSEINEEWLKGWHSDREGIFPKNYVKIVVPKHLMTVIAIFPFIPETWDDLELKEGDEVKVLSRINNDWLYGECDGKKGQFPDCYTQDISDLAID